MEKQKYSKKRDNSPRIVAIMLILIFFCSYCLTSCDDGSATTIGNLVEKVVSTGEDKGILPTRELDSERYKKLASVRDSLKFKEHWVFYVDYSYSMVWKKEGNDSVDYNGKTQSLMAHVKEQLAKAIPNIKSDGELSIDIVSFYDETLPMLSYNIRRHDSKFAPKDISDAEDFIYKIEAKPGSYYTHHYLAVEDFIKRCTSNEYKDWVNIMVLLTDGKDEANETPGKHVKSGITAMNGWKKDKEHKWYGVFVDLKGNITDELASYFDSHKENNLFKCYGMDFNFNFFNIKNRCEIAYRSDSILKIPHSGNAPQKISFSKEEFKSEVSDGFYNYTLSQSVNKGDSIKYFEIKVLPVNEDVLLEDKTEMKLLLYYDWGNSITNNIPDKDELFLTVYDDKTPVITINIENNEQKIRYYDKWHFSLGKEHSDTTKDIYIKYLLDKDAVKSPTPCKIEICDVPSYMQLFDKDGNTLSNGIVELEKKESGCVAIKATVTPNTLKGNYIDSLDLKIHYATAYNTIIVNGKRIENSGYVSDTFIIKTIERWHPISIWLFRIILILLILWMLILAALSAYRAMRPKFTDKIPVLQFGTIRKDAGCPLRPNWFSIIDNKYLYKPISYIRLDTHAKNIQHSIWCWWRNWWKFKLALDGDTHIHPLGENIFADTIELRPTYKGNINIYVDGVWKCEITQLGEKYYKVISEREFNGESCMLIVYGLQQPIANN